MYFNQILRAGVLLYILAGVATHSWLLLSWAALMLCLFWVQRDAPQRFPADEGRELFLASTVTQCSLSIVLAVMTGATGAALLAIGMSMNVTVILANGGRMPITCEDEYPEHDCYTEANEFTRLLWMCDHFRTTETASEKWFISPGDVLECVGIWVLAAEMVLAA